MSYKIFVLRRAQKELAKLHTPSFERVRDAIYDLAEDPKPIGCKKLVARDGFRIRIGEYRVIYEIDNAQKKVTILDIGHRKDIYQ